MQILYHIIRYWDEINNKNHIHLFNENINDNKWRFNIK